MEGCILHGRSARSATAARLGRWSRHLARPISHKSTVKNWSSQLVAANLVEPGRGWSDRFFPKGIQRPGSSGCNGGVHFALNHKRSGYHASTLDPFGRATLRLSPRQVEEKNPPFLSDGFPDEFTDLCEPYFSGISIHLHPVTRTYRIPLTVFLSSFLGLPVRAGGGRWGSISFHCSSVSSSNFTQSGMDAYHQTKGGLVD